MSKSLLEENETHKALVNGNMISKKTQTDNRKVSDQKSTTANAGEIYNGENYGIVPKHKKKEPDNARKKAKAYDEKLKHNEISHKSDNVNQDYANAEELMKRLPDAIPHEVKSRVKHTMVEESHNDATDIGAMRKDVVKFHRKKTAEMLEHKEEAMQKIMNKFGDDDAKDDSQRQAEL